MVDKENLGDNNMSSEQVGGLRRGRSFQGPSHAVFFLTQTLPGQEIQPKKNKPTLLRSGHPEEKESQSSLSRGFRLPFALPDVAKNNALRLSKSCEEQVRKQAA